MARGESLSLLRGMMLIRAFETALAGRRDHGFQLLSSGEEAVAVGLCSALDPQDQLLTGGRSIGPALARGVDPARLMAELLGRSDGTNAGKGGRGHLADPSCGFFGAHAVVAGNISIAAGVALSRRLLGEPGVVVVMFGDGACGAGILHETLNIAALWRLPLLFVCDNNQMSVSTPRATAIAAARLSDLGAVHGVTSRTVDGMDVEVVADAAREALDAIRAGEGPRFLECVAWRFASHSTTARETRSPEVLAAIRERCPIAALTTALTTRGALDGAGLRVLQQDVDAAVAAALAFADASPFPLPAEATADVW
jgi:pyruvate dehydrogenase E1 component alpha subunit